MVLLCFVLFSQSGSIKSPSSVPGCWNVDSGLNESFSQSFKCLFRYLPLEFGGSFLQIVSGVHIYTYDFSLRDNGDRVNEDPGAWGHEYVCISHVQLCLWLILTVHGFSLDPPTPTQHTASLCALLPWSHYATCPPHTHTLSDSMCVG